MNPTPPVLTLVLDDLVARASALVDDRRFVLGITGPPGSGKSTVAEAIT